MSLRDKLIVGSVAVRKGPKRLHDARPDSSSHDDSAGAWVAAHCVERSGQ